MGRSGVLRQLQYIFMDEDGEKECARQKHYSVKLLIPTADKLPVDSR